MKPSKWLVVPLGQKNVGIRPTFVMNVLHQLLGLIAWPEGYPIWGAGFQLQHGEPLAPDSWAKPYLEWARDNAGGIILHWEVNQTKQRLRDAAMVNGGVLDDWLIAQAEATALLLKEGLIRQAVFHNASLVPGQPGDSNLVELARCPFGAREILDFRRQRAEVRCRLTEICGEALIAEPLDPTQFWKRVALPRWFEGQDGNPLEMKWECDYVQEHTGIRPRVGASDEHWAMGFNFYQGFGDWKILRPHQRQIERPTAEERELADQSGVWYREGEIPVAVDPLPLDQCPEARTQYVRDAYELLRPISAQVGASLEATALSREGRQMLGTHRPFNLQDASSLALLEWELRWALSHPGFEIVADATLGAGLKYGAGFGPLERQYGDWGPEDRPVWDDAVKLYDPLLIAGELYAIAAGLKAAA